MPFSLPDIDPAKINTLDEAKEALNILMNSFERLAHLFVRQEEKIRRVEEENRRLKGLPKKPHYPSQKKVNSTFSLQKLLKQKGVWHKSRKNNTLPIDKEEYLPEAEECVCGNTDFRVLRTKQKVVQGMIILRHNVLYRGRDKRCMRCGKEYKTKLPKENFTTTLKSLVSFFKFGCRMTYPLMNRMFKGFGVQMSNGKINEVLHKNSTNLIPSYQHLKTVGFSKSSYLQSDATGAKRKNQITGTIRNQYVQIIGNKLLSVFAITKYYNATTLNRLLGKAGRRKPFVSDDGSPNGECLKCKHKQLCFVHEIRHYKKLFPFCTIYHPLEEQILSQWSMFYHTAKQYGKAPPEEQDHLRKLIEDTFEKITNQTTHYDDLNKQLRLTRKKRDRLLTFLNFPFLPIHNNQCEQDLREYVIQRKISGETKSYAGDKSIARHLSVIQTAQKQGLDVFSTLHGLLTGALSPQILTASIS